MNTAVAGIRRPAVKWSYEEAFCRNLGLIERDEQQRLRQSRVAIVGMGGVGGVELVTLARLGVGKFTIADPDTFENANTNRQYGAYQSTLGQPKAATMAEIVRDINPEADVRIIPERLGPDNVDEFLQDAQVFVDGIDFFEIEVRRLLFRTAAAQGIWGLTAGPIGFSTAWLAFDPQGMSFDRYFDLSDEMSHVDKLIAFQLGLTPGATQMAYRLDLSHEGVDIRAARGPCTSLACQLSAGVVAAEILKILLGRGPLRPAPCYQQFDPYVGRLARGRLIGGNRHPLQRLKGWVLRRKLRALGISTD